MVRYLNILTAAFRGQMKKNNNHFNVSIVFMIDRIYDDRIPIKIKHK